MKTLTILWLIFSVAALSGQNLQIGFSAGFALSNLTSDNSFWDDSQYETQFVGGLNADYLLSSHYAFGIELLYLQQGYGIEVYGSDEDDLPLGPEDIVYNYSYLALPLTFGYQWGEDIIYKPFIGFQPAFLLDANIDFPSGWIGIEESDITDRVTEFDFAILAGFTVKYRFRPNLLLSSSFSGRYSLTTLSGSSYFDGIDMFHYSLSLTIGLHYELPAN
jgi:hypothetical protein